MLSCLASQAVVISIATACTTSGKHEILLTVARELVSFALFTKVTAHLSPNTALAS